MEIQKIFLDDLDNLDDTLSISNWEEINTLWGVGPAAPLHLGYDSLIVLQKKLLEKNPKKHSLIMADIHSILSHKFSWQDIRQRCYYYEHYFRKTCNLKSSDFVLGSYFQTRADYVEELYSVMGQISLTSVRETLPTTKKNIMIPASISIYPLMQCLDIFHLNSNLVIAERGQEKIYDLCNKFDTLKISRIGKETKLKATDDKLIFLYIPTSHDIDGKPLIESTSKSRISIHDSKETLFNKIKKMYTPPFDQDLLDGRVNAALEFFKYSVFPWFDEPIAIKDFDDNEIVYNEYKDLEINYKNGKHTPQALKEVLNDYLWKRLSVIQNDLSNGIDSWIDKSKMN